MNLLPTLAMPSPLPNGSIAPSIASQPEAGAAWLMAQTASVDIAASEGMLPPSGEEHLDADAGDARDILTDMHGIALPWIDIPRDLPVGMPVASESHSPLAKPTSIALSSPALPSQPLDTAQLMVLSSDLPPPAIGQAVQAAPVTPARADALVQRDAAVQESPSITRVPVGETWPAAASPSQQSTETASIKTAAAPNADAPEQKLLSALGERIRVQAGQGIQQAVIRLDPHLAGSVHIELRHEAGVLQVRLSASQADVAQQLQTISDGLRQELNNRQFNDVTVHVGHGRHGEQGGRGGQQHEQNDEAPWRQAPGRALVGEAASEAFDAAWKRAAESGGYKV